MQSKRSAVVVLGIALAVGLVLVWKQSGRANPLWLLWAPLAIALCLAEGAVLVYGVRRWDELKALQQINVREVAQPTAAAVILSLALVNITFIYPGPEGLSWQNSVLLSMALVSAAPTAGVMLGVSRRVEVNGPSARAAGSRVALLMSLRQLHQRLLAAVGSVVALTTLQAGALLMLERSLGTGFGSRPPEYVLVFGGGGSLLVATIYAPGWVVLTREAHGLSQHLFSLDRLTDGAAILAAAEGQQRLDQVLGTDRSIVADLQAGVLILAPLIAAATAFFLI